MNNLITISDFKNPYLVFSGELGSPEETYLNELIAEHQEIILKRILGVQMYNEFETNIADTFWVNFINGVEYTYNGDVYHYKGIKQVIARMLFYWWNFEMQNSLVSKGAIKLDFKEGIKIIPTSKMINQFNIAVELIQGVEESVYNYIIHNYTGDSFKFENFEKLNTLGI